MSASFLDQFRLDGKVAIVTGGGRGIGAACARALAEVGADVAIVARTKEQLDQVAHSINLLGRRGLPVVADVTSRVGMEAVVEATLAEFGRIDIVINNAGGGLPSPFMHTSEEQFRAILDFNVTTAFNLTQLAVPHMLEAGSGAVVNISSAAGRVRSRGFVSYGVAKAALNALTRHMAVDLAPKIRVNAIAPGAIATEALDKVLTNDQIRRTMEAKTPLRRIGTVGEVATAAVYLCSPASAYVTGKILDVDGGIETSNFEMPIPDL